MSILAYITSTILAIGLGFFIGRDYHKKIELPKLPFKKKPQLKVLKQEPPKTFEERRDEALKKDKPMIRTMYK